MFLGETCKQTSWGWKNELMWRKVILGGDETEHGLGPGPDETNECCWMNEGNFPQGEQATQEDVLGTSGPLP